MGALQTYAFINAKLRARISKILPEEFFQQMVGARSLEEAVQLLRDTDFAAVEAAYHRTGDVKTAELELAREEAGLYRELEAMVREELRPMVQALAARFEIDNLKNALRLWFDAHVRGRAIEGKTGYLLRQRIRYDLDIDAVVNAPTLEAAAESLAPTPYAGVVAAEAPQVLSAGTLFPLEIALDKLFYRQLAEATQGLSPRDQAVARRLIGVEIDLQNVGWLIRFKDFYDLKREEALRYIIPWGLHFKREAIEEVYGGEGAAALMGFIRKRYPELSALLSASERPGQERGAEAARLEMLEQVLGQILLIEVRRILAGYPFTIGIVLAYFILKGEEIRRVVTILNAKYYGWPEERIRTLL